MQLERLLVTLADARVDFIIVGGVAARAHGSARITQDVYLAYSRTADNIARLVSALAPYEPYPRGAPRGLPFEWSVPTVRAGLNFTLTTALGDIDLLGDIAGGGSYDGLLPHTIMPTVFRRPIRILDLPWLIRVKRAAGRPKDFEVIAELEALAEEIERRESGKG